MVYSSSFAQRVDVRLTLLQSPSAKCPAAFHPGRREIDLVYREVFGGFRPSITLTPGAGPLVVHARAEILARNSSTPIWRQWTFTELERQMSPRSAAVSMRAVFD